MGTEEQKDLKDVFRVPKDTCFSSAAVPGGAGAWTPAAVAKAATRSSLSLSRPITPHSLQVRLVIPYLRALCGPDTICPDTVLQAARQSCFGDRPHLQERCLLGSLMPAWESCQTSL